MTDRERAFFDAAYTYVHQAERVKRGDVDLGGGKAALIREMARTIELYDAVQEAYEALRKERDDGDV